MKNKLQSIEFDSITYKSRFFWVFALLMLFSINITYASAHNMEMISDDLTLEQEVTYNIGNHLWVDEDGDGDQDAGENGISGVLMLLYNDAETLIDSSFTDANGRYLFDDLMPGDYIVVINTTTLPIGLNNQTFDSDGILNNESTVIIVDKDNLDIDFGYNWAPPGDTNAPSGSLGAIGDRIWNDVNGDGVQDDSEAGIAGVTVILLNTIGIPMGAKTTNVVGNYIFDNLSSGVYSVIVIEESLPDGFVTIPTGDPDDDGDNVSESIVLAPGDIYLNLDFGYSNPTGNAIGSMIFLDTNADGMSDETDLPLGGVTVTLCEDPNGNGVVDMGELPIASMDTDENGNYLFDGLPDGNYIVAITDAANITGGLVNTADPNGDGDEKSAVTLNGEDILDQIFGYTPEGHSSSLAMIRDFNFLDTNSDGVHDVEDQGVEGVKVDLFDDNGDLIATTATDAKGMYLFGALVPDTYVVKVDPISLPNSADLIPSVDPDGGNDNESMITLVAGEVKLDQKFGYKATTPNTIGGTIWDDLDANGTMDETDPILFENVTVVLNDDLGSLVGATTTDVNGFFSFPGIPDGTYTVDVTDDAGILEDCWASIGPNPGEDNNSQSDGNNAIVVSDGQTDTTSDFGYYKEGASIGNTIWIDRNNNGIQEADEAPFPLVVVTLEITYPDGSVIIMTDKTDAQGHYSFDNLLLDEDYNTGGGGVMPTYELFVETPIGFIATQVDINANANDMEDSDDPTGTMAIPKQGNKNVLRTADPNTEEDVASYDFGFTLDNTEPIVEYAITNGAITNPGQTTDFFYQDDNQNLATNSTHVPLIAQNGVIRCIDYYQYGTWRYYFNPADPDEYLFAIEHGTNVTPIEYIELSVEDTPTDRYEIGLTDATYVMARDWFVRTVDDAPLLDAAGNPATVNIRFYFPEEEFKEIIDQAAIQAAIWGVEIPTADHVYWFKKATWDVATDIDEMGNTLIPFDITHLQKAATTDLGQNTVLGTSGSLDNVKNHIQFDGIDGFSGGTAAITVINPPLPVALIGLETEVNDCEVTVNWTAAAETTFSHYIVEKSRDGIAFETAGTVKALQTVGSKYYDHTISDVNGDLFLRLKLLNLDGSYSYSTIVQTTVRCKEVSSILKLFPNPVAMDETNVNIEFTTAREMIALLRITDNLGVEKMNFPIETMEGNNRLTIDISNLPAGSFNMTLYTGGDKLKTQQFIIIRD